MRNLFEILRDLVTSNWWLKLSALVLALVLWLVARGAEGVHPAIAPPGGHAQSIKTKMYLRWSDDDMHSSPAAVRLRTMPEVNGE